MILDVCRETPSITIPEMAEKIGITERSVQRNIQKLQAEGFLRRVFVFIGLHSWLKTGDAENDKFQYA
jgi:DeoR/GlpR family transcriptional regulator of sugar metabolism